MLRRLLIGVVMASVSALPAASQERSLPVPAPAADETAGASHTETAVLAGGCFWGVQAVFNRVKGVTRTAAGYSGGSRDTANYEDVSTEKTQHAESLKITFDPQQISYGTLLRIFFSVVHDPTQWNRQDNDIGPSYRSAIFYNSPEQQRVATAYIAQLEAAHVFEKKIVTQVVPLKNFYDAELYHQDYAEKNPNDAYIQSNDLPKIAALKAQFPDLFQIYRRH